MTPRLLFLAALLALVVPLPALAARESAPSLGIETYSACTKLPAKAEWHASELFNLTLGQVPSPACGPFYSQIVLSGGDITGVGTNEGLTGGGTSGQATVGIATGGVTQAKLAFDPATQVEVDSLALLLSAPGTINNAGNPVDWTKLKGVPAGFADGADNDSGATAWQRGGNDGNDPTDFLGTTDDQALDLKVNGTRALRLEPTAAEPNVIGGDEDNLVETGFVGSTIAGGGGERANEIQGANYGTIGGGSANLVSGDYGTVPGGASNWARGPFSFAAGNRAIASDQGSFVWGDSTDADVSSTGQDQFVVRANGGFHLLGGQLFCAGCVSSADLASNAVPGLRSYCALAQSNPLSYPDAPCRAHAEAVDTAGNRGSRDSLAIGVDGNPVISHYDATSGDLRVARCNDPACAGANETLSAVDTSGAVGDDTSLAIGTDGNPVISYYDVSNSDLKVARCNDPACAGANETLSAVDTSVTGVVGTSITIGTDGNPVISYVSSVGLKVARCNDPACTGANEMLIFNDSAGFGDSSIAIGTDGYPVISYVADSNSDLRVAHCRNPTCSSNSVTPVDQVGLVGEYSSLAIGTDGNPVVSYYDATNGDLKVARCLDVECLDATPSAVDQSANVGSYTSIAIGADGNPVVSYNDISNNDLKVAVCNDPACSGLNETLSVVDAPGSVGAFTSIAIGTDGQPVVSYLDSTNNDLKVGRTSVSG